MSECTVPVRTGCAECDQVLKVLMADIENWEELAKAVAILLSHVGQSHPFDQGDGFYQ